MLVCHRAVVSDREVVSVMAGGACTLAQICRATSAGRGCGSCVPTLRALLCQHDPDPETSTEEVARAAR
jgi:bacterioferritin-associated ferredoxin